MDIIKYGFGSSVAFLISAWIVVNEIYTHNSIEQKEITFLASPEKVYPETPPEILDLDQKPILDTPNPSAFLPDWSEIMVKGVKKFEGYYPKPYYCPAGVLTVGYGHTGKHRNRTMSKEEASRILLQELEESANIVDRVVRVKLDENQKAALVSFTFNAGEGNLRKLVNGKGRLNEGNYQSIEKILPLYRKGGGVVLRGLEKRRKWEVALWKGEIRDEG